MDGDGVNSSALSEFTHYESVRGAPILRRSAILLSTTCTNRREETNTRRLSKTFRVPLAVCGLAVLVLIAVPRAEVGSTSTNGSEIADANRNVGLIPKNGFLFEPEVPLASLKTLPIWNEIEQMLDNP